jgi:hypothetical protein
MRERKKGKVKGSSMLNKIESEMKKEITENNLPLLILFTQTHHTHIHTTHINTQGKSEGKFKGGGGESNEREREKRGKVKRFVNVKQN